MPAGLQQLFAGKLSWSLPPETVVEVEPTTPTPLPKKYQEDTEKYASQVSLVQNSDGGYAIKGYVAGVPFPKPSGAAAGVEILYNEYYAYIPYLITTYSHLGFSMDRYANKYQTEVREVNFKLKHLSDPGKPTNIPEHRGPIPDSEQRYLGTRAVQIRQRAAGLPRQPGRPSRILRFRAVAAPLDSSDHCRAMLAVGRQ